MASRRIAIIGISSVLLVAVVATLVVTAISANRHSNKDKVITSQKAIQDLCQITYYQQTCHNILTKASNSTDTKTLIKVSLQETIKELSHVISQSAPLQEASKDPRTFEAYKTCQEVLDDSIYDLNLTIERIDSFEMSEFAMFIDDVKTWLTGALTFQDTCMDGFEGIKGDAAYEMEQLLKESRELTVNGLALANEFHKILSGPKVVRKVGNVTPKPRSTNSRKILQGLTQPNVIVAKDGSGKYKSINEALKDVPDYGKETFTIYIKEGVYEEYLFIEKKMKNVMFIGDGPTKTKITGSRNHFNTNGTYHTGTVLVEGEYFVAKDIGFENTSGPMKEQAAALRVTGDQAIFYNCQIDGYQDTLYAHSHRQFYRDCTISGTIDFIFGNAASVFQDCTLIIRKPLVNQACMVTAQGRSNVNQTSAIVLQNCSIVPEADYPLNDKAYKSFLGRPWKELSRTIIMDSEISSVIDPKGWSSWNNTNAHLDTCYYAEVDNTGPGSNLAERVKWGGIKTISMEEAEAYTPGLFLEAGGSSTWIAAKGIPYEAGLTNNFKSGK